MKKITFDANGGKLWVSITANGLYAISFTFDLLAAVDTPPDQPVVLTEPIIAGDNLDKLVEHHFQVLNTFHPDEALALYDGRFINTSFFVKKLKDDPGFSISAALYQGDDFASAVNLGGDAVDPADSTVGDSNSYKEVGIKFQIAKNNEKCEKFP
jgi:hypothetical protein